MTDVFIEGSDDVYTYTPDLMRPFCPTCQRPVGQGDVNPEEVWIGTCPNGHTHRFQLEDDYDEEE